MFGKLFGQKVERPASAPAASTGAHSTVASVESKTDINATTDMPQLGGNEKGADPAGDEEQGNKVSRDSQEESGNHVFHGVAEMEAITTLWSKRSMIIAYVL